MDEPESLLENAKGQAAHLVHNDSGMRISGDLHPIARATQFLEAPPTELQWNEIRRLITAGVHAVAERSPIAIPQHPRLRSKSAKNDFRALVATLALATAAEDEGYGNTAEFLNRDADAIANVIGLPDRPVATKDDAARKAPDIGGLC